MGETDNLRRRGYHYRNPGPTQPTNQRLNGLLLDHLAAGQPATLEVAAAADLLTDDGAEPLDFTVKAHRVLAEHAALLATATDPAAELLNL